MTACVLIPSKKLKPDIELALDNQRFVLKKSKALDLLLAFCLLLMVVFVPVLLYYFVKDWQVSLLLLAVVQLALAAGIYYFWRYSFVELREDRLFFQMGFMEGVVGYGAILSAHYIKELADVDEGVEKVSWSKEGVLIRTDEKVSVLLGVNDHQELLLALKERNPKIELADD
ncbi:MAG: hypothetical protein LAT68_04785 [Cyclobacteriaceae bacterium]|nr:hypothetical protein [Cyclobacteriaceae bacterium]MCH8515627.1 hypothetical protein [Cyclobacteriaceae bacterium]